ncbi:Amino-transferase class IV [Candidatus Bilamarchaeum dharawalense]|uniref:Amino-transferase class IV n=1 Tax=Candidatus Bilamarchaeum dharawalense TaxID=2885759 RepID=A0A5E4LUY2_9ARCH|nr:Amino-transferase class IV [Candidatus Bilamarchaeum dharawalense]
MELKYFLKNNEICPISEAVISLFNIEHSYGFGVYENVRVKNSIPFFINDHVERLFKSAEAIGLEHQFTEDGIIKCTKQLIEKLEIKTLNLKMLLIGAKERKDSCLYVLPLSPHFPDEKFYRDGVKTITKKYERWLPQAKTLNMLPSYIYYSEAKKNNCYDVLFLDKDDCIIEGSRTNFFAMTGKTIITAPEERVLSGVTRKHVITVAKKNGYDVQEKTIAINDLKKYQSVFLTSTSSKIMPVRMIDKMEFAGPTKELKELIKNFDEYLKSQEAA